MNLILEIIIGSKKAPTPPISREDNQESNLKDRPNKNLQTLIRLIRK